MFGFIFLNKREKRWHVCVITLPCGNKKLEIISIHTFSLLALYSTTTTPTLSYIYFLIFFDARSYFCWTLFYVAIPHSVVVVMHMRPYFPFWARRCPLPFCLDLLLLTPLSLFPPSTNNSPLGKQWRKRNIHQCTKFHLFIYSLVTHKAVGLFKERHIYRLN